MRAVRCVAVWLFRVAAAGFGGHGAWDLGGGREVEGFSRVRLYGFECGVLLLLSYVLIYFSVVELSSRGQNH